MSRRNDRVNKLLRHEISQLLSLQIKDPRLRGVISITRVSTSSDLREAEVFLSVMGDSMTKQTALEGIRSASTFLRRELRPRLTLRYTPFLKFVLDEAYEEANHILVIMDRIREEAPAQDPEEDHDTYVGPLSFPAGG